MKGEQSTANASQHLQALQAAGLVSRRREGTSVRYALAGDDVLALWLALPQIIATAARMPGWLLGWFIKKQLPPANTNAEQQPVQPVAKPPRPRRRSNV